MFDEIDEKLFEGKVFNGGWSASTDFQGQIVGRAENDGGVGGGREERRRGEKSCFPSFAFLPAPAPLHCCFSSRPSCQPAPRSAPGSLAMDGLLTTLQAMCVTGASAQHVQYSNAYSVQSFDISFPLKGATSYFQNVKSGVQGSLIWGTVCPSIRSSSIKPTNQPTNHRSTHSPIRSVGRLFIHSFIHLFIHSFIQPSIHSFMHLFVPSFIHSFIYSFIQFIYSLFVQSKIPCVRRMSCIFSLVHRSSHIERFPMVFFPSCLVLLFFVTFIYFYIRKPPDERLVLEANAKICLN